MQEVFSRTLDYTAGLTGCRVISGTSAVTGAFQSFIVNEAAVVSQILDQNGVNLMSSIGLTGVTLSAGILISAPKGAYFSSITLASGSVVAYGF